MLVAAHPHGSGGGEAACAGIINFRFGVDGGCRPAPPVSSDNQHAPVPQANGDMAFARESHCTRGREAARFTDERDRRGRYASAEIFDPATGAFTAAPDLRLRRYKHRGTSVLLRSGKVLLAGGAEQAEVYDPATGFNTELSADVPLAGHFSATALLPGGRVLIVGGYGRPEHNQQNAWIYEP